MHEEYHKMAIVVAFLNCYDIPNLLVPGRLQSSQNVLLLEASLEVNLVTPLFYPMQLGLSLSQVALACED